MHAPSARLVAALLALGFSSGCYDIDRSEAAADAVRAQDLGTLPYHPLVLHLDLSILAYQLYGQSLVWPFDPYYEELDNDDDDRDAFMELVREWATARGAEQEAEGAGIDAYRGPGRLTGFEDNPTHDPILYQYSRLHPWSHSVTNAAGTWTEYLTPAAVTERIRDVHVCSRAAGEPEGTVIVDTLVPARDDAAPGAEDVLMAFEGGTGDKGEPGQPPSHSLLGFALLRATGAGYDVHIAFRGSRSGSATRAALEAFSTEEAQGNPDWITDLGYRTVDAPWVSTTGEVSRGMSRAVQTAFPQLLGCLDAVVGEARDDAPVNIYVTGHSLGGALAQHLVSGLLLGDTFGPDGPEMPATLQGWPWRNVKLVTYGAPRVGDAAWAETLTVDHLGMDFLETEVGYDRAAIGVTDLDILPRLTDPDRPAGYRVLVATDPITSGVIPGGFHVGKSVYLSLPDESAPPDSEDHEPAVARDWMVDTLRDDRIPPEAWAYHELSALNPERDDDAAGTPDEYRKLMDATRAYYETRDLWFDRSAYDEGTLRFEELLESL